MSLLALELLEHLRYIQTNETNVLRAYGIIHLDPRALWCWLGKVVEAT